MKKERQHVSLRHEIRRDGKDRFIVTWTPTARDRRRLTFSKEAKAIVEADRIEKLMQQGHVAASKVPKPQMAALIMLCEQMIPDVPPFEVVQFYLDGHKINGGTQEVTAEEVGNAFVASRADTSELNYRTVRQHIQQFLRVFKTQAYACISAGDYKRYLVDTIGGAGRSQNNHLTTLRAMSRWARDVGTGDKKFLPAGKTAAEEVVSASEIHAEHPIYSPEQFVRLLAASCLEMVPFLVLGQFAGIRAAERTRLKWRDWRQDADNKLVLQRDITKTGRRRIVDVLPCLTAWLETLAGAPEELMVSCDPYRRFAEIAKRAAVPSLTNALRAGYASYHLELFDNAALTAKNDGHSVTELETTYKSISGVTKKTAAEMFAVTPAKVLAFVKTNKLPAPLWVKKIA